jgi:2-dehydro-3-deoxygluconokinase
MYDLVAFGEALIRLNPPNFRRIEQANSFELSIGGSELNIAVGASRLGLRSCWISRLPTNQLGFLIRNKAREQGVETSHIIWCKDDRVGVCYVEYGASPRASSVIYDRKNSSFSKITANEVNWNSILKKCKIFVVSGITPALSVSAKEAVYRAVEVAKKQRCKVCIDLNYRSKLWSKKEAKECMLPLMYSTDILMTTYEASTKVLGIKAKDHQEIAERLNEKLGIETVVITMREIISVWKNYWTAVCYDSGKFYKTRKYALEIVDRVGGGDSLTAAFLQGYLEGDIQKAIDNAVAFSAIKHTHFGDFCLATLEDVPKIIESSNLGIFR